MTEHLLVSIITIAINQVLRLQVVAEPASRPIHAVLRNVSTYAIAASLVYYAGTTAVLSDPAVARRLDTILHVVVAVAAAYLVGYVGSHRDQSVG